MKFGKELVSQMVPEWQNAYMNYNQLKSILKDIKCIKEKEWNSNRVSTPRTPLKSPTSALKRKVSMYRAFSGLTRRHSTTTKGSSAVPEEEQVILVNMVTSSGDDQDSEASKYETMFLMSSEEGGEYEMLFFKGLDEEFNKVHNFYKSKVEEVQKEAKEINKQMDALIAFRLQVHNPSLRLGFAAAAEEDDEAEALTPSYSKVNNTRTSGAGRTHMDVINETELSIEGYPESKNKGSNEAKASNKKNAGGKRNSTVRRPTPAQVLEHFKINVTDETPWLLFKNMLVSSNHDLTFSIEELRKIEEQLERAFIELYQKLRSIKSYSFMNMLAFSKIMKKYDKVTSRCASKSYLKMVDNSYLGSSDEVSRLMERVEAAFIKHFSNGNRRKGMNTLRPQAIRAKHRISFFLGLLFGCTIALMVAIVVLIHVRDILKSKGRFQYMENIFPLYSLFGFIVLHLLMYGANIYFWRRYCVNYPFIFGFKQGKDICYREVFLISTGIAVLSLAGVLSNLEMEMEQNTKSFETLRELVPLGLLIVLLLITFCPFNIIYRSTRFFLLKCVVHCIFAPLYKVTLPDFFLADQFTSQVQAFRSLEFYICYYGWGDFKRRQNNCQQSNVYKAFYIIVAVIPYWIRLLQCLRRLFEEKGVDHAYNGMKYLSTIVAVVMRTFYDLKKGRTLKIMAGVTSVIATIFGTYWDLVMDWGLLQRTSRNRWLRDKLLISDHRVYFAAMIINVLLRLSWMQSVLDFHEAPFLHRKALSAIMACLEIIRRGMWTFFRLENEHLNNVGKFRAFKSVPLPFNHDEDEDG